MRWTSEAGKKRYLYLIKTGYFDRKKQGYKIGSSFNPGERLRILQNDKPWWIATVSKVKRGSIYSSEPSKGRPYRTIRYGLTFLSLLHCVPFSTIQPDPEKQVHSFLTAYRESVYELFWLPPELAESIALAFSRSRNTNGLIRKIKVLV